MAGSTDIDATAHELFEHGHYQEAHEHYLRAAENGSVGAMLRLGWMLLYGKGVSVDASAGEGWYQRAADTGLSIAQFYLGDHYWRQDKLNLAFLYMERAAEQLDPPAVHRLGAFYEWGIGTPQNFSKAKELYGRAAELGHLFARRKLVGLMLKGEFGLAAIPAGFAEFVRVLCDVVREHARDPESDLLRR
ncbi:MAG TPA: tetratricopeptide repeat protein [Alphaproteobacteria bacterium]|nr:tetratricopeptide repeat protein [Alphaproteobacteria bacterium]